MWSGCCCSLSYLRNPRYPKICFVVLAGVQPSQANRAAVGTMPHAITLLVLLTHDPQDTSSPTVGTDLFREAKGGSRRLPNAG